MLGLSDVMQVCLSPLQDCNPSTVMKTYFIRNVYSQRGTARQPRRTDHHRGPDREERDRDCLRLLEGRHIELTSPENESLKTFSSRHAG